MCRWDIFEPLLPSEAEARLFARGCGRRIKGCEILLRAEPLSQAGMAELADAADSKSADRKVVGVRPPLPAPALNNFRISNLQMRKIVCA